VREDLLLLLLLKRLWRWRWRSGFVAVAGNGGGLLSQVRRPAVDSTSAAAALSRLGVSNVSFSLVSCNRIPSCALYRTSIAE
jgi:hypothetical protein